MQGDSGALGRRAFRGRVRGMETLRYVGAALAAGLIAVFVSENLFWSAPRPDFWWPALLPTWGLYGAAAAVALSAVAFTGCGGWRGFFLGGAVMGFMVEGVAVDTMYDAFPLQLVWTPLAWHALLTGLAVGGLGRMAGVWPVSRLALAWVALGLLFGVWALYWPAERGDVPTAGPVLAYSLGCGLAVPAGNLWLSRLARVPRPHGAVLLAVPVAAAVLWGVKTAMFPSPVRLALPLQLGLTFWAMAGLGQRGAAVSFGPPAPPWRHALALLMPATAAGVLLAFWGVGGGLPTNIIVAVTTGVVSLAIWLWLVWRAAHKRLAKPL